MSTTKTRLKKLEKDLRIGEKEYRTILYTPEDGEDEKAAYLKAVEKIRKKEPDFNPEDYNIIIICLQYDKPAIPNKTT